MGYFRLTQVRRGARRRFNEKNRARVLKWARTTHSVTHGEAPRTRELPSDNDTRHCQSPILCSFLRPFVLPLAYLKSWVNDKQSATKVCANHNTDGTCRTGPSRMFLSDAKQQSAAAFFVHCYIARTSGTTSRSLNSQQDTSRCSHRVVADDEQSSEARCISHMLLQPLAEPEVISRLQ